MKWLESWCKWTGVLFLVFYCFVLEHIRVGQKRPQKGTRSTHTRPATQLPGSSSWLWKPPGPCLLGAERHSWGKAAPGTSPTLPEMLVELNLQGSFMEPTAAAQLLFSLGSGQRTLCATGTWSALSKEGVSFSHADTFSWDAALTIEKPKNLRIFQPIQTVSRSTQSFFISTAQFLKKIWRAED